jgi:hypothetical protein
MKSDVYIWRNNFILGSHDCCKNCIDHKELMWKMLMNNYVNGSSHGIYYDVIPEFSWRN